MKNTALRIILLMVAWVGTFNDSLAQDNTLVETTLLWDSSLSMKDRDIAKDFSFLESYFAVQPDSEVSLLLFSNTVQGRENFSIRSGRWGLLKQRLSEVNYDGGTSFNGLSDYAKGGNILLFTDGHQNTNTESPSFNGNVLVVNSQADFNQANLNLLAILSGGTIINLAEKSNRDNKGLKRYYVNLQGKGIANREVQISIKGSENNTVRPAEDGSYSIQAREGDILVVTDSAGNRLEKVLEKKENIDIRLLANEEIALEEVVLTGEKEESVEQTITGYGNKNKDAVGYAVQTISEGQISDVSTTVNNALQGKFSGVRLGQGDDLSQVIMRPSNSVLGNNYGLIVVDGVPLKQSDSGRGGTVVGTEFLDPKNIADVTVLKGLAATNRFGSMGANGVIMIRTKTGLFSDPSEKKDLALLDNNIYEGKLKISSKTLVTPYLKALKKAKNLQEAYAIYLEQREQYSTFPAFYIDVFEYFQSASRPLALRVLTNVLEDNNSKYNSLRAMLFMCRQRGMPKLELETAEAILERYPELSQSYMDYAMALKNNRQYQESLNQLLRMAEGNTGTELNFEGLKKTIRTEIRNLVHLQAKDLDLSKVKPEYRNNLTYDARVAFEWSYPNAEFELQFVNPQKRFFTWEHTSIANSRRLQQEWEQGFSREEFEIIGQEARGEWQINLKYLGNTETTDQTPLFIRCVVTSDFGKQDQKEKVYVARLHEKDEEEQLLKLKID
ncbi:MAG: TonB-dependent receptor plug domain-containing protein [Flavobacteriaceae bacterium]